MAALESGKEDHRDPASKDGEGVPQISTGLLLRSPTGKLTEADFGRYRGDPPCHGLDALIRDIRGRQAIIRSLLEDSEAEKLPFIGSATMNVRVPALAETIVRQIEFDVNEFRRQDSMEKAFAYLRLKIEETGIFVLLLGNLGSYHTNIPVDMFRGFALADDLAPLAIINDNTQNCLVFHVARGSSPMAR